MFKNFVSLSGQAFIDNQKLSRILFKIHNFNLKNINLKEIKVSEI